MALAKSTASDDTPSEALRRVRSGELTLEAYLEWRVEDALQHLKGRLAEDHLDALRDVMREQIEADPVVREMIRQLTGREPATSLEALRVR